MKEEPAFGDRIGQRLGEKHRPRSSSVNFVILLMSGIGLLIYVLVNNPCWVRSDCNDGVVPDSVEPTTQSTVDSSRAYPEVNALLDVYKGAVAVGNVTVVLQQFAPDATENSSSGVAALERLYLQRFATGGRRELEVSRVQPVDGGNFVVTGELTDSRIGSDGGIQIYQTPFSMTLRPAGGKLRLAEFTYDTAPGSGS